MVKILTNETPTEQLQRDFTTELKDQMKAAALKMGCPVEQLAYRVGNDGVVEICRMNETEAEELHRQELLTKKTIAIRKGRGHFYG